MKHNKTLLKILFSIGMLLAVSLACSQSYSQAPSAEEAAAAAAEIQADLDQSFQITLPDSDQVSDVRCGDGYAVVEFTIGQNVSAIGYTGAAGPDSTLPEATLKEEYGISLAHPLSEKQYVEVDGFPRITESDGRIFVGDELCDAPLAEVPAD